MPNLLMKKIQQLQQVKQRPFVFFALLPILLFACYQLFIASVRFESQAQVIVQQPDGMATMDTSLALLSGMGMPTSGSDTELVKTYIKSFDMLQHLDTQLQLRQHYSQPTIDYFSRLHNDDSREDFLAFYLKHIDVFIEEKSNVVVISTQGFDAEFAQQLTQAIVDRAEWYINSIGHQLAEKQLEFIGAEHKTVEKRLKEAQLNLLSFQQQYNLLDPTAEGLAMQQITYTLESQISAKRAQLKGASSIMSSTAPQVIALQNELQGLEAQLHSERNKLSLAGEATRTPVSEILSSYANLKIKGELALQAYTSSQISLEKARIEAYRQLKFLVVVEQARLPQANAYPTTGYNISLFAFIISALFGVVRIISLTIKELK